MSIEPAVSIARAARPMDQKRVKRLPVAGEAGKILRIVSRSALLKPSFDRMEKSASRVSSTGERVGLRRRRHSLPCGVRDSLGARAPSGLTRFPYDPALPPRLR